MLPKPSEAAHWTLEPQVLFLNHGSYGACPRSILEAQGRWRERLERDPVRFFARELPPLMDEVRQGLGALLECDADDLALVSNATAGVNTVLRSLRLTSGDELLTTSHAYGACRNALNAFAAEQGARVVTADIPFPLSGPEEVETRLLSAVTARTRLVLLDHITSPTGLIFPVERLVATLRQRGVETLVDGAHAPGMVPLSLHRLGAAYYTGNCHKWLCTPKGSAFLHIRRDLQERLLPLSVSHGWSSPRTDRSRFRLNFDEMATQDPTAWLCIPEAIRFLSTLFADGLAGYQARNRTKALEARRVLCARLGVPSPAPDAMIGALASVPLPDTQAAGSVHWRAWDPLSAALFERHQIEVPVWSFPAPPRRLIRISAQAYNSPEEYVQLAEALVGLLETLRVPHGAA